VGAERGGKGIEDDRRRLNEVRRLKGKAKGWKLVPREGSKREKLKATDEKAETIVGESYLGGQKKSAKKTKVSDWEGEVGWRNARETTTFDTREEASQS